MPCGPRTSYISPIRFRRDGLGRFPDLNVGEAIQRIPGVQINREADGRAATISLRGLPGTFAHDAEWRWVRRPVGQRIDPARRVQRRHIFTSITVIKSPTAANLAGGLSGNIDLRIAPALSRKEGGFIKASYEYNDLGKLGTPELRSAIMAGSATISLCSASSPTSRRSSATIDHGQQLEQPARLDPGRQPGRARLNPVYDALIAQYPGGIYYPSQTRSSRPVDFFGN